MRAHTTTGTHMHADPIEDAARVGDMEYLAAERAARRHRELSNELINAVCTDPAMMIETPAWRSTRFMAAADVIADDSAGTAGADRMVRLVKLLGRLATGPVGVLEHQQAKALLAEYAQVHADQHCEAD